MANLAHRNLCGKNTKIRRISEKSAASAKDLKNPRYRTVLVNDLLQISFSPALLSSSISASSFDLNNYTGFGFFAAQIAGFLSGEMGKCAAKDPKI
jgi:hypothetical protein